MPTYTDPETGRKVTSAEPLSPDEIQQALGVPAEPAPTYGMAGPGLEKAVDIPEAATLVQQGVDHWLTRSGPPTGRPLNLPPAEDVLPNPLDMPGILARKAGLGPVVDFLQDPANQIALSQPPMTSPVVAGTFNAGMQGILGARDVVRQRMAASSAPTAFGQFEDAMASMTSDDLWNVGTRMIVGFGLGAGTTWGMNKLTGPMRPATPSGVVPVEPRPARTLPLGELSGNAYPLPFPSLPTDDQVAAVAAREAQMGEKAAVQDALRRSNAIDVPPLPGAAQDAAVKAMQAQIPEPDKAVVDAAYGRLREAYQRRTGGAMVDVTEIVDSLARTRSAIAQRSGTVPAAIDPADLKVSPYNERPGWLAGVMAPGKTRWLAPLDVVQRKLSAINTLKNNAAERATSGLDIADLTYLSKRAYEGLRSQLQGDEPYLLDQATNAARMFGRLSNLEDFINSAVDVNGVPQGKALVTKLLRDPDGWRTTLGDIYEPALTWAKNVAKLQEKEIGARAVASLTRMAQQDADALVGTLVANTARGVSHAAGIPVAQAGNVGTAITQAAEIPVQQAGNLATAISEAAQPPALGASDITRNMTSAMGGSAIGAAAAYATGVNPAYGALGMGIGGVVANRILDPVFRRGFDALARHPVGSQAFVQQLGRLGLLLYDESVPLEPSSPPALPLPTPTPSPLPLGRVGAP